MIKTFPKIALVKQRFKAPVIEDIPDEIKRQLSRLQLSFRLKKGDSVAITAGSRGIANISLITKTVVDELKDLGTMPFIVPAMGSHGGGTADGQKDVLKRYGITEETMGVPVKSSMDVVEIGRSEYGIPVYLDKNASQADHIAVINRIKVHTRFIGAIESGIVKMLLIGLGKREGATMYHRAINQYSFDQIIKSAAPIILSKVKILFGLAILENAYEQVARIEALKPDEILEVEPELQKESVDLLAKLPFSLPDLLIIDEMGKDISGTGMDTNVIGKKTQPSVGAARIFIRDLTPKSHGNACGIGLADFTTQSLVDKIDYNATYINCITGQRPEGAKIPMTFKTDKEAIEAALATSGLINPENAKIMWIKNTLELEDVIVSDGFKKDIETREDIEQLSPFKEMEFDHSGNLVNPVMFHKNTKDIY